jgi:hypothetical protein
MFRGVAVPNRAARSALQRPGMSTCTSALERAAHQRPGVYCGTSALELRPGLSADTLASRATQCSFSSAFHIKNSEVRGFSASVEQAYMVCIVPAVLALAGAAALRLLR